jgi:hypothetical protein
MARSLEEEMFMSDRLLPTFTVVMGKEGTARDLIDALWWSLDRQIWNHIEHVWKDDMNSFVADFIEISTPTPTTPCMRFTVSSMGQDSEFEIRWDTMRFALSSRTAIPERSNEFNKYESLLALLGRRQAVWYHAEGKPFRLEFQGNLRTFTGRYGRTPSDPPPVNSNARLHFETRFSFHPWTAPDRSLIALMDKGKYLQPQPVVRMLHPLRLSLPKQRTMRPQLTLKVTGYEENMCILQTCLSFQEFCNCDTTTDPTKEKVAWFRHESESLRIDLEFGNLRHLRGVQISLFFGDWVTKEWSWSSTSQSFYGTFLQAETLGCFSQLPLDGQIYIDGQTLWAELYVEIWSLLTSQRRTP